MNAGYNDVMSAAFLEVVEERARTADGWQLHLRRTVCPGRLDAEQPPLLIVPGYGMNSFIFSFHPRGTSMERTLAEAGFEVWSMNLRGQGDSRPGPDAPRDPSLLHYATVDVPTAVDHVLAHTRGATANGITLVGCSLGGSVVYSDLALRANSHRAGRIVAMGAPLRWTRIHPLMRALFSSPRLASAVRLSRTRDMVRGMMPLFLRMPALLSIYMNPATIDTGQMREMTRTVEDPHPRINRSIAFWMRHRDLELDGVNITHAMADQDLPLLVVLANRDGIVPEQTALSAVDAWGGRDVEVLRVGDRKNWYAHANMFIDDDAPRRVFHPMIRWLRGQG